MQNAEKYADMALTMTDIMQKHLLIEGIVCI